jgi:hypothetical protein
MYESDVPPVRVLQHQNQAYTGTKSQIKRRSVKRKKKMLLAAKIDQLTACTNSRTATIFLLLGATE